MTALRTRLIERLAALGVQEQPFPGRDDGFAGLLFNGKEFAHFHGWSELDIRMGKQAIAREGLVRRHASTVHPTRSPNSPWYEIQFHDEADIDEVVRLVRLVLAGMR